jgi:hypothetical protein
MKVICSMNPRAGLMWAKHEIYNVIYALAAVV